MSERGHGVSELGKLPVLVNSSDVEVHPSALQEAHVVKKHFDWNPIKEKGIDGFVAEAEKRGLLEMTSGDVQKQDSGFYSTFFIWLKDKPKELQQEYHNKIYGEKQYFDWSPIKEKGIDGFVAEAEKRGLLGMMVGEVQKKDGGFCTVFDKWLKTQPEELQREYRDKIYSEKQYSDWVSIIEQGIDGFVVEAEKRGLLGMTNGEVREKDKSFHSSFRRWIGGQSEELKKRYRERIYGPKKYFDWQPIRDQGIDGFVAEAEKRGLLGMTVEGIKKQDSGFYTVFDKWLKTQPEELQREYRNRVYKAKQSFDWNPVRKQGIDGFVAEAEKRGLLGMMVGEVQKKDGTFGVVFRQWLKTQPKELQQEYKDRVYKKVMPNLNSEVVKTLEVDQNKEFLSQCAGIFGHSNLVDIFYAVNPQFKSVARGEVRKYLAEYLGDFLVNSSGFDFDKFLGEKKNSEIALKLLQTPDIYQAFLLNVKQECLHFYNQGKRDESLKGDSDVFDYLEKIISGLEVMASNNGSDDFKMIVNNIFLDMVGYYSRLGELVKSKPDWLVGNLGSSDSREFPDFSQRINILEFLNEKRILVADEMGMGKTASAILAKEYLEKEKDRKIPALVVMPKGVVGQWLDHLKQKRSSLDSKACFVFDENRPDFGKKRILNLTNDGSNWSELGNYSDYDYILVSQEILSNREKIDQLKSHPFQLLITDELHLLKNTKNGKRANNFLELVSSFSQHPDNYFIGLSGTPIPNKVQDIAIYLQTLYPDKYHPKDGQTLEDFNKELVAGIIRSDNLDLRAVLMPRMQMKSLNESVEMPGLNPELVSYELTPRIQLIYDALLENDEVTAAEKIIGLRKFLMDPDLVKTLPGLEKLKIDRVNQLLGNIYNHQNKKKIVMFFSGPMEGVLRGDNNIKDKLIIPNDVEILTIHGDIEYSERDLIQSRFQTEDKRFLLLVNSSVSGVGIDLSSGEAVIHFNEPWTIAEKRQCVSRVYRPGQTSKVTSYTSYAEGTIEEGIHDYIHLKESIINKILHGIPLTEIERVQISESEDLSDKNPEGNMSSNIAGYLMSDFNRLLKMFTVNKGVGEEQFNNFLETYADEYAGLYKKLIDYSYQANGNRIVGNLIDRMIGDRGQNLDELQIADLASGPMMLRRHAPVRWQSRVQSMDLNERHFGESDENVSVGSLQETPYEDNSLDYINLSFALHYTEFVPSIGKFERLGVFQEINRTLKNGGVAFIDQIYSQRIQNIDNFRLLMSELGFELLDDYSGNLISGDGEKPNFFSTLLVLKKVKDLEPMEVEDLFELVNRTEIEQNELKARKLTDVLKIRSTKTSSLKRQRNMIDNFVLKTFDGREIESNIEFNQHDEYLYQQQVESQQEVSDLLSRNQGKVEQVSEVELNEGRYVRYKMGGRYFLLKIVQTEFGESILFV